MKVSNGAALAVEKYENENAELIHPNIYLRVEAGPFGSVHMYPVDIKNVTGGCSGYEWDTGNNWEDNEGAHLRIPLRTYLLERWVAYQSVTIVGLRIYWDEFDWETNTTPTNMKAGESIVFNYHLSSDEDSHD